MPHASTPNPAVTVDGPSQLSELIRRCGGDGTALVDYGIAHTNLGHPPPAQHIQLTPRSSEVNHDARDLVVHAAAGVTLAQIQETLRASHQFLPIDADGDLTLGEAIMHNVYGPLRVGYGGLRDLILGLRYIDGLGRDIHVGGRTVKNVAGYNVTRLMVGALGELGCVYHATLRTSATPLSVRTVEARLTDPTVFDRVGTDLLVSDASPTGLSLTMQSRTATIHMTYHGHPEGCDAQYRALQTFIQATGGIEITESDATPFAPDDQQRADRRRWRRGAPALIKIIVPPASTGWICQQLTQWAEDHAAIQIEALPIHGCVFAGGQLGATQVGALNQHVDQLIAPLSGLRVWHARPAGAESIPPFAPAQPDWPLLARLKHAMDPHGLFNPGRLLPVMSDGHG